MKRTRSNNGFVLISLLLLVITMVINALSATGLINGYSQKAISEMFQTSITPAGYAFSIWSVIYVLLFVSLLILFFKSNYKYYTSVIKHTSILFWISCVGNIAWTFAFSYQLIWLSAILIIVMLVSLLLILRNLQRFNPEKKSLFDISIGIYAGWLFVATIVNIAAFFVSIGVSFFESYTIVYALIILLAVVGAFFLERVNKNPFFHLAIIWAYVGILVAINFVQTDIILFGALSLGLIGLVILFIFSIKELNWKK